MMQRPDRQDGQKGANDHWLCHRQSWGSWSAGGSDYAAPSRGAVGVIMEVCVVSETSPSCSALGLLCGSGAQVCPLAVSGHTSCARRSSTSWQG